MSCPWTGQQYSLPLLELLQSVFYSLYQGYSLSWTVQNISFIGFPLSKLWFFSTLDILILNFNARKTLRRNLSTFLLSVKYILSNSRFPLYCVEYLLYFPTWLRMFVYFRRILIQVRDYWEKVQIYKSESKKQDEIFGLRKD